MCTAEVQNAVTQKDEKNWRWKTVLSLPTFTIKLLEMQETHKDGRVHDKAKMQVEIQWGTIQYLDKENCLIK